MRVKINFDIIERLKEHEEKIKNAFAASQNLERFTDDDKFVALGHLKAVCFFLQLRILLEHRCSFLIKETNNEATRI